MHRTQRAAVPVAQFFHGSWGTHKRPSIWRPRSKMKDFLFQRFAIQRLPKDPPDCVLPRLLHTRKIKSNCSARRLNDYVPEANFFVRQKSPQSRLQLLPPRWRFCVGSRWLPEFIHGRPYRNRPRIGFSFSTVAAGQSLRSVTSAESNAVCSGQFGSVGIRGIIYSKTFFAVSAFARR